MDQARRAHRAGLRSSCGFLLQGGAEEQSPVDDILGFPELAKAHFSQGKLPYFESVRIYLLTERDAGAADIADPEMAAAQFLGMISNYLFWPSLVLPDWTVTPARMTAVVDEAVRTMVARYGAEVDHPGL